MPDTGVEPNPKEFEMKAMRIILVMTAALGLSACASVDTVSRNQPPAEPLPIEMAGSTKAQPDAARTQPYHVVKVDVIVPTTLKVSEANSYFPRADIVWREDPLGDRYAQVQAIVQNAAEQAVAPLSEGRDVVVEIQVARFHALTERTRYTIGGTHDIHFYMTVLDAKTGTVLEPPRMIETEFKAYGGTRALEAMSRGETQKVRITTHLVTLIRQEMNKRSQPSAPQPLSLSALSSSGN